MALLNYLHQVRKIWDITLIACSVDHMLRGETSKSDVDYVASFCKERDILFESERVDVLLYKKEHHLSTEVAARICRYRVFKRVMKAHHASTLALAHHGDDQVETMLMRQVHGSFSAARSGIPVKRPFAKGTIIRPFLTVTKDQIEWYCRQVGIEPRRDLSNDSDDYMRNRFRRHVLPFLKKENPLVHLRFQQESEIITQDQLYLDGLAKGHLKDVVLNKEENDITVSIKRFRNTPAPLQRRVIHLILNYLYDNRHTSSPYQSIHIETLINWLHLGQSSGQQQLPNGLFAVRSYDQCRFSFQSDSCPGSFDIPLVVPGTTQTPVGKIIAEVTNHLDSGCHGLNRLVYDFNSLHQPLRVRTRQNGDRMTLAGMEGTQKIKDIFINAKVDQAYRSQWPLVVDANEAILWLPLLKHSRVAPKADASEYLIFTFKPTVDLGRQQNER